MSLKKDIYIFIQAPREALYALSLYEENYKNNKISIIVIKTHSTFKYLQSLNLKLKNLKFIEHPNIKSFTITSLIFLKKITNNNYENNFEKIVNSKIYFFSNSFDYFFIPILLKLNKNNKCTWLYTDKKHIELNKAKKIKNYRPKDYILQLVFWFLAGEKVDISIRNVMLIVPEKFSMESKLINDNPSEVFNKYSEFLEFKKPSVLMFESPSASIAISNYKNVMLSVIDALNKNDVNVYVKPHPQKGISDFLEDTSVNILNQGLPGELIDIQNINIILGINSSAIIKIAKKSKKDIVFSLVGMFEFYDNYIDEKALIYNTLKDSTGVGYINTIEELNSALKVFS